MHAFHFGSARRRLFGLYHPPAAAGKPAGGVVLCPPFGHEYIRSHRALRNLAVRLSEGGLHVLKFDYFGCGDSAGGIGDGSVAQWQEDVGAAIDELKDMTGLAAVSLVGLRFGATLASLAIARRSDVRTLVLWDPVLRGAPYVEELRALQADWLQTRPRVSGVTPPAPDAELIGFPLTPALHDEFKAIDLLASTRWRARRVVTMATQDVDVEALPRHLDALGVRSEFEQVVADCAWQRPTSVHLQLQAPAVIARVAAVLEPGAGA
jgi:pimeloyl-ACP methyl ester carboxylesterase